jgi:hypothetical protein
MGDINEYMSLLEASRELGVSKSRMEQYVRDGRLSVEWVANQRVVLRSAVAELKKIPRPSGRPKSEPEPKPATKKGKGKK